MSINGISVISSSQLFFRRKEKTYIDHFSIHLDNHFFLLQIATKHIRNLSKHQDQPTNRLQELFLPRVLLEKLDGPQGKLQRGWVGYPLQRRKLQNCRNIFLFIYLPNIVLKKFPTHKKLGGSTKIKIKTD